MPLLFTTAFPFPYPFPAHVYAVLNKYPNPEAAHVISIDVLERSFLPDGSIRSERLIGIKQDAPKWVNRLLGSQDITFVREVSFLVPSSTAHPSEDSFTTTTNYHLEPPKLLMASTNLTLSYLLQCRESISYLPHPWPYLPSNSPTLNQIAPLSSTIPVQPSSSPSLSPDPSFEAYKSHPLSHPSLPPHTLFSQSALIFSTGVFASENYPPIGISIDSPIPPQSNPRAKTAPQRAAGRRVETWSLNRFQMNAEKGISAMNWAADRFWNENLVKVVGGVEGEVVEEIETHEV